MRKYFDGPLMINGGYNRDTAAEAINNNQGDLAAFGTLYLANPDLVNRFNHEEVPLNNPDPNTFYTPGEKGYIDYPSLKN